MLRSGWMDDRRGLRPRLLFKTNPGGKGAGTRKRNWMLEGSRPREQDLDAAFWLDG
jgi:hypothetical protein